MRQVVELGVLGVVALLACAALPAATVTTKLFWSPLKTVRVILPVQQFQAVKAMTLSRLLTALMLFINTKAATI